MNPIHALNLACGMGKGDFYYFIIDPECLRVVETTFLESFKQLLQKNARGSGLKYRVTLEGYFLYVTCE